jgi:serine/threonine-protein kinase
MGVEELQRTKVGRYQLGDCLGHGSYTAVYRASTPSGASSALKVVDTRLQGSEDLAERLRQEAAVLHQIGHPSILPIWDPMGSSEMTAAAMPLMVAPTLRDLMRGGRLDSDLAWSLLNQIADSLQSAHEWGLTYRLLKPVNILVRDGRAYLSEFGIAGRRAGRVALTTPDFHVAAPQYLAPEQVLGEEVNYRADIYAFAVLVFELATGTPLRDGARPSAILQRTLNGPPPSAHERNPDIPREVDGVLHRAMARDPAQRQASVSELINELANPPWSDGAEPVPARRRPPKREPTGAVVTVESLIDVLSGVLTGEDSEGEAE